MKLNNQLVDKFVKSNDGVLTLKTTQLEFSTHLHTSLLFVSAEEPSYSCFLFLRLHLHLCSSYLPSSHGLNETGLECTLQVQNTKVVNTVIGTLAQRLNARLLFIMPASVPRENLNVSVAVQIVSL